MFVTLGSVGNAVSGFAFWTVVTRHYSDSQVGSAGAIFSAISMLSLIATLGMNYGLIRFLPHCEDKKTMVNSCLTITVLLSAVLSVGFLLGLSIWSPPLVFLKKDLLQAVVFAVIVVGASVMFIQRNTFLAFRLGGHYMAQLLIAGFLRLAFPAVLVFMGVLGIVSSYGIAMWVSVAVGFIALRYVIPRYRPGPALDRALIGESFRFSFKNLVAENLGQLPVFLLPLIMIRTVGGDQTAYYYVAYSLATVLFNVPGGVVQSLYVEGSHEGKATRKHVLRASLMAAALIVPALLLVRFLGSPILGVFGKNYSTQAWETLWYLSLAAIPLTFNEIWVTQKRVKKEIKPVIVVYSVIGLGTILAAYIFMHSRGAVGAGMGWAAGQGAVALVLATMLVWSIVRRPHARPA